jgi:hypothetical protein
MRHLFDTHEVVVVNLPDESGTLNPSKRFEKIQHFKRGSVLNLNVGAFFG